MSEYLPVDVLDQIGTALAGFYDKTCVISRPPVGLDAAGAPASGAYTPVATVDCHVQAAGARAIERIAGPRYASEADFIAQMPRLTPVQNDDRIAIDGTTVEVVFVPDLASDIAWLEVLCRQSE